MTGHYELFLGHSGMPSELLAQCSPPELHTIINFTYESRYCFVMLG